MGIFHVLFHVGNLSLLAVFALLWGSMYYLHKQSKKASIKDLEAQILASDDLESYKKLAKPIENGTRFTKGMLIAIAVLFIALELLLVYAGTLAVTCA